MRPLITILSLAVLVNLGACFETVECTELAAVSVIVTVVDDQGTPMPEAQVFFSVDGAAEVACEGHDDAVFMCGYEELGEITVTASAVGGYTEDSETVFVELDEDGCHVVGQSVELVLEALLPD